MPLCKIQALPLRRATMTKTLFPYGHVVAGNWLILLPTCHAWKLWNQICSSWCVIQTQHPTVQQRELRLLSMLPSSLLAYATSWKKNLRCVLRPSLLSFTSATFIFCLKSCTGVKTNSYACLSNWWFWRQRKTTLHRGTEGFQRRRLRHWRFPHQRALGDQNDLGRHRSPFGWHFGRSILFCWYRTCNNMNFITQTALPKDRPRFFHGPVTPVMLLKLLAKGSR